MNDHQHLQDAFAEYERRADAIGAVRTATTRSVRTTRAPQLVVAASVLLVLAVAGVVVWLAAGTGSADRSGAPVGANLSTAERSLPGPSSTLGQGGELFPLKCASCHRTRFKGAPRSDGPVIPRDAQQMTAELSAVLGDSAKFTVTDTSGNYIQGVLTVAGTGAQGGYNIQASIDKPGDTASCPDPGQMRCRVSTPADGGSLAVGQEPTEGNGTLYLVDYIHPNGAEFLMLVSNLADPKGAGQRYGDAPPLTTDQLVTILQSPKWGDN